MLQFCNLDIGSWHLSVQRHVYRAEVCQALLLHHCSLTYTEELFIPVGHTKSRLAIDFARGGVKVASLRERGEMGNTMW